MCTVPEFDELVSSPTCSTDEYVIYNQQCSFSCPTGYSRAGPSFVICTGSGSFSQMFPRCVKCDPNGSVCPETVITCTVPIFDELVSSPTCSTDEYVIFNQQCSFSCPTGYSLDSPSSVTCTASGSFSQMFPRCVDCENASAGCKTGRIKWLNEV
ncbi:E-selectin-like [Strongylocentrotus purpuratus]|uniref:Sushi domain-containing protein n=1 Tax=Strongylocentrotus purpuratus TaxID=7668 RepID=A0A7M7P391_STRPU|nr:E-selectin-like [Strongylocentrotus purpuratus]